MLSDSSGDLYMCPVEMSSSTVFVSPSPFSPSSSPQLPAQCCIPWAEIGTGPETSQAEMQHCCVAGKNSV